MHHRASRNALSTTRNTAGSSSSLRIWSMADARPDSQALARRQRDLHRRSLGTPVRFGLHQRELHRKLLGQALPPRIESWLAGLVLPAKLPHRNPALLLLPDQFPPETMPLLLRSRHAASIHQPPSPAKRRLCDGYLQRAASPSGDDPARPRRLKSTLHAKTRAITSLVRVPRPPAAALREHADQQ